MAGLLFLAMTCAAEPKWPGVRLEPGQVVAYAGDLADTSERPGKKYRHAFAVEVTWVVLAVKNGAAECVTMTTVTPRPEQSIANATIQITGQVDRTPPVSVVRVEFVKLLANGAVQTATLPNGDPPFATLAFSSWRTGPKLQGPTWRESAPFDRFFDGKAMTFEKRGDELWNGSRVVDFVGKSQSQHFDDLAKSPAGYRRTDRVFVSPTDGLPRAYVRTIEQREGKAIIATAETKLAMSPPPPVLDAAGIQRVRREGEWAVKLADEADGVVRDGVAQAKFRDRVKRIIAGFAIPSAVRPALESLAR
jgi:hypothetical protein